MKELIILGLIIFIVLVRGFLGLSKIEKNVKKAIEKSKKNNSSSN